MLVRVKIDSDVLVEMLDKRLSHWTSEPETHKAFKIMYQRMVESSYFDDNDFEPEVIVDNDWNNYTTVIKKDHMSEADWKKLEELEWGVIEDLLHYDAGVLQDYYLEAIVGNTALIRK